ncbi:MAG TPA: PAS domain-containing protein, partial [Syntrophorhabdaceae bacterium]|nr:PAS domain-containing protein [Syntrophorhabdaceae bacterium]
MDNESTISQRDVILDSINEGVFTVDKNWQITFFNKAAERITGITKKEALGRLCSHVFHASICEENCALKKTFETGNPIMNHTAYIVNNKGMKIPIRISTAILKDNEGNIIGGVETFQDLSQIDELQKELKGRHTFEDIVGKSPSMIKLFDMLPLIAESTSTVLIEGPSGTGKELFARA